MEPEPGYGGGGMVGERGRGWEKSLEYHFQTNTQEAQIGTSHFRFEPIVHAVSLNALYEVSKGRVGGG